MSNRVLILGRPNVGKSTLFNRILGRRKSIVHDLPGVTRDLLEAEASWKGKSFILVDSGGIWETKEDIWERVKGKVQDAISKAQIVLFVVDGREGLTATDEYIAKLLYPHKEKVFLVVNKIDNERLEKNVYEFFALSFERVFPVSSQHGRNIGELLDAIYPLLEEKLARLDYSGIKVSFVGRVNVGKSSLINALLNEERVLVSPVAGTTRDAVEIPFMYKNRSLVLIDTAGIRRRTKVDYGVEFFSVGRSIKAIDMSDVVCLVLDLSEGITDQDKKIAGLIERRYKGCVIVGNKFDLVSLKEKDAENYIKSSLYFLDYAPIALTVATQGKGLENLLDNVLLVYTDYTKIHKTSFVNRAAHRVIREKKPPAHEGKEIKVYYSFQESACPPTFVVITNEPEGWKQNYRKFFVRRLREHLRIKHSPLKLVLKGREE